MLADRLADISTWSFCVVSVMVLVRAVATVIDSGTST